MSLDYVAPDLSGYSGPQDFVDNCSYPDLAKADDVWPTRTLHGGRQDMPVDLVPNQLCVIQGHSVALRSRSRIIIADAALSEATVMQVRQEPSRARRGLLVANRVEGLDSGSPVVTRSREAEIPRGQIMEVRLPARGVLKVIGDTWRREDGAGLWVSELDERQWQEYLLGQHVRDALINSGK